MPLYSHSKLSCFEDCKLKYKCKYIDSIKTDVENTIEAFLGDLVHQTLEKLYRDKLSEKTDELKELLLFYNNLWKKEFSKNIKINELKEKNYHDMGVRFITDYYERYKPFNQGRILGIETKDLLELKKDYKMHVRIDR